MVLKKNNKGFSLVEMMVAVAILSVVMIAIGAIMSAMSKSFGNSQREVQLQNSVQSTYTIVSELIKEAQSSDDTIASVQYDAATNRAYIIVENTTAPEDSIYYIIELLESKDNLYLYTGDLYSDPATKTLNDYKSKTTTLVCQSQNLLATNVSSFEINTDKLTSGGYVVLGLECAYGSREASVVQNVYLRNSNMSAEWVNTITSAPTDDLTGYTLESIVSSTCSKSSYNVGATPQKTDFVITGNYVNDSDPTDTKQATVPDSAYTSDQLGVQLTTAGTKDIVFKFTGTTLEHTHTISVIQGSVSVELEYEHVLIPEKEEINHHSEIKTYYSTKSKTDSAVGSGEVTKTFEMVTPEHYACPKCNGTITIDANDKFKCNLDGNNPWYCEYNGWKAYTDTTASAILIPATTQTVTNTYKVGIGQVSIVNESTVNNYNDVVVRLYFDMDDTGFFANDGSNFLIVNAEDTTGNQQVKYSISGSRSSAYSEYIEVKIPYMPKGSEEDGYATYSFTYYWASADASVTDTSVIAVAVYNVETN